MLRFAGKSPVPLAALVLIVGSGTLTAGVWDFWKSPAKKSHAKETRGMVVRAQEPTPAPPNPVEVAPDPAYDPPATVVEPSLPPAPVESVPMGMPPGTCYDCAPQYSGFSSGHAPQACMGHACTGHRENGLCGMNLAKSSARMHGDSFYNDCYPLFGPRYGYYETCWRRLPEDCRCPVYVPPRKSQISPVPEQPVPEGEVTPPPPQVLNFR